MDGGGWWATVHGVAKSRTRLSGFHFEPLHRKESGALRKTALRESREQGGTDGEGTGEAGMWDRSC